MFVRTYVEVYVSLNVIAQFIYLDVHCFILTAQS